MVDNLAAGPAIGGVRMAPDPLGVDCERLVPAARPDVLTADNADQVRARVILEGANTTHVLRQVREFGTLLREAAEELARARIAEATGYRRSW